MSKAEILAPVGNISMLNAAIAAGADSFYLALDDFGARAYAENFNLENIKEVIDYIHLFGKKVFITMNILIKDEELDKAIHYVEKLYSYGADALIIQDLGFFTLIKDNVSGLDLHASTQMAVNDYNGAKYLSDIGFDRIVIARETSIDEIKKIATLPVELEVFIHGSLCVSYSGECLMSSYFGSRSANRGRCAGPCRQRYDLINESKVIGNDYYLNMKDLNVIDDLDELLELNIDCLKIEGRMKTPEYVYNVVKNYRQKLEQNFYNKENLQDSSNRGYTKGFIFGQNDNYITLKDDPRHRSIGVIISKNNEKLFISNSDLIKGDNLEITTDRYKRLPFTTTRDYKKGEEIILINYPDALIGSDVLLLNSNKLTKNLDNALGVYKNLPVEIDFKAKLNEYPEIKIRSKKKEITLKLGKRVEEAYNITIKKEDILENLSKFNDEIFTPVKIQVDMDDNIFLRKKDINQLRREGVDLLKEEILKDYHRGVIDIKIKELDEQKNRKTRENNIELLTNDISVEILKPYDNIYLRKYDDKYKGFNIYLNLDSHDRYEINTLIKFIKDKNIKGVIFNNYRDLCYIDAFRNNNIKIRIGRYLNVFNSYTFDYYSKFAEMISSSVENNIDNINKNSKRYPVEVLTHGRIELMNMRHCPFSVVKKCELKGCVSCKYKNGELKNEAGNRLIIKRFSDYSKIYPYDMTRADITKLSDEASTLISVMDDHDIININSSKIRDNYKKGVI